MDMKSYLGPNHTFMVVLHSVSALTCLFLFYRYSLIPRRGLGLKMIIVLCISNFIFHSLQIGLLYFEDKIFQTIGLIIVGGAFRFSIYWAASIALFLYSMISQNQICGHKLYLKLNLIILSIIGWGLSALFELSTNDSSNNTTKSLIISLSCDVPSPVAIILTAIFYFKSISILKNKEVVIAEAPKEIIKVLYEYGFVQIFTMGPQAVYFTIVDVVNWENEYINWILIIPYGLTGLINAFVYFFKRSTLAPTTKVVEKTSLQQDDSLAFSDSRNRLLGSRNIDLSFV